MSGMHNQRADHRPVPPLDFAQGKFTYTSRIRRRNRRWAVAAALSILAVATGLVTVLLANWLSTVIGR
jgi:hypothetical protein